MNANPDKENSVSATAQKIAEEWSEVIVSWRWFERTGKVEGEVADDMLRAAQTTRKGVSLSKRLLAGSDNEWVKACREAKAAVEHFINKNTLPEYALNVRTALMPAGDGPSSGHQIGFLGEPTTVLATARRLIKKSSMQEFDDHVHYLLKAVYAAVERLHEHWNEVVASERKRLGERLFRPEDYDVDVRNLVGCTLRYRKVTDIDVDWKELCPGIYEREARIAAEERKETVKNAALAFAETLVKFVEQVVRQLGNRVRLNPLPGQRKVKVLIDPQQGTTAEVDVTDAEVCSQLTHADDPDNVPEDHVLVELRLQKTGKGKSPVVWLAEPMREKDFRELLRPYETLQKNRLYASSLDNIKDQLEAFLNVGEAFGPYRDIVAGGIQKIKDMMSAASGSMNSAVIAEQLRSGEYFRSQFRRTLEDVANQIKRAVGEAKDQRRSIRKSLIGNVG
jgi:hypothetical protein